MSTQTDYLVRLREVLVEEFEIDSDTVVPDAHLYEDLDIDMLPSEDKPEIMIRRKLDPGPCFPWQTILDNTLLKRQASRDI